MEPSWHNAKHAVQWRMTLEKYCQPIRSMRVDEITADDVLKILEPLRKRVPETAKRLRGRIENVLDAAKAKGQRSGEYPARWRGHLDQLLPKHQKLTRGHHTALSYDECRPSWKTFAAGRRSPRGLWSSQFSPHAERAKC